MSSKVQPLHLQRRAVVYVRQSTLRQLFAHPESTRRQYALRDRAEQLGWRAEAIDTIDDDLGQSGADTRRRVGFRRLCEDVARGVVGAIFVLELSRLSRSSTDWHRLLDLCGVADVLLVDEQGIYHPSDANDRLVLGIKGTMSEAERGWIQLRLRGARLSKARRGDYRLAPPVGYLWDRATARLRLDPDEEVQSAVRLVFERFGVARSACGVVRYFVEHGLRLPARSHDGTTVRWGQPRPSRVLAMLHNPTYAGAYVFGRRSPRVDLVDGVIVQRSARLAPDAWQIVHRDHHPAYLTWEEYVVNRRTLEDNRINPDAPSRHGTPRRGDALLQGIAICGRCGHRMHVSYSGRVRRSRYVCTSTLQGGHATQMCWSVAAAGIDEAIGARVLAVVTDDALAAGLAVAEEAIVQGAALERQWSLRVQRARYEAHLAERRYKAVDPDNRTVARALEQEWEAALAAVARVEREHAAATDAGGLELSAAQRAQVERLARDLPRVWSAATTTMEQRKVIVRTLIREVVLEPRGDAPGTAVKVLWQTGHVATVAVARQRPGNATAAATLAMLRELTAAATPAGEIAAALNRARVRTWKGYTWTAMRVHVLCRAHGIRWPKPMPTSRPQVLRRADGLYSTRGVARRLRVLPWVVLYWVKQGWLTSADGGAKGHPHWFRLDAETLAHLRRLRREHTGPKGRAS